MSSCAFVVKKKKAFNDQPFAYHQEIELEIATLTNLRLRPRPRAVAPRRESSIQNRACRRRQPRLAEAPAERRRLGRDGAFYTPRRARDRARVFRNHKNFSEADLVRGRSRRRPDRVAIPAARSSAAAAVASISISTITAQREWKRRQVAELLQHMAGIPDYPVAPVIASPREFHGYRSKITPHFNPAARRCADAAADRLSSPGHALRHHRRATQCPIATDAINVKLTERPFASVHAREAGRRIRPRCHAPPPRSER